MEPSNNNNNTKMYTPDMQLSKVKDRSRRENILVFARVRPMNSFEKTKNSGLVVDCPGQREVVCKERGSSNNVSKTFTFDRVFGPNSKQVDVYKCVVAPLLDEVLQGYNCTVFAYGQTGTGKTFTMEGERTVGGESLTWESDPLAGIVPRAMSQLFDELRVTNSEFTARVSLVEMYNEELYDLLSPSEDSKPRTVRLFEDSKSKGSVHIQGLEEVIVHNKHEVYAIMERGSQMRKTASTLLNASSSRSHTVFTVTVHVKESNPMGEDLMKIGKLHLVDLAGSENIGRSGAVDKRAREAGNINQSLLTLGRVITALVERTPHIPYRESKLTRLLQDSLGGRTKTSIIATVSPASINIEETLSTLDYAHRAKNIQNRPEVNQKLTKKAMIREYTEEIERLRKDLQAAREKNGIYIDQENYERMISQIESQDQDLTEKVQCARNLEEQVVQKNAEILQISAVLEETKDFLAAANMIIAQQRDNLCKLKNKLKETEIAKEEVEHLVKVHYDTESKLTGEAATLLTTAEETTVNLETLYNKLERKKSLEQSNYEEGQRFRSELTQEWKSLGDYVDSFRKQHSQFSGEQRLLLDEELANKNSWMEKMVGEVEAQNKQREEEMMTLLRSMQRDNQHLIQELQTSVSVQQNHVEQQKLALSQHCEAFSTSSTDVKDCLQEQSDKLDEFWDFTYRIDSPTGSTPVRKPYQFPRQLSATSPHDRIIGRFRASRMPSIEDESESGDEYRAPLDVDDKKLFCGDENQDPLEITPTMSTEDFNQDTKSITDSECSDILSIKSSQEVKTSDQGPSGQNSKRQNRKEKAKIVKSKSKQVLRVPN